MAIPIAIPSKIPQAIFYLSERLKGTSLGERLALLTSLESVFYSSIKGGACFSNRFVRRLKEISVSHVHAIQTIFNVTQACSSVFYLTKLIGVVRAKYSLSLSSSCSIVFSSCALGQLALHKYTHSKSLPVEEDKDNQIKIYEEVSSGQKLAKHFQFMQAVASVALAYLNQDRG